MGESAYIAALADSGIEFERPASAPLAAAMPAVAVVETLAIASMPEVVLVCVPRGAMLDVEALAGLIGEGRTAALAERALGRMTGFSPGGVTPLRAPGRRRFPVFLDAICAQAGRLCLNAGAPGENVILKTKDFIKQIEPRIVQLSYVSR